MAEQISLKWNECQENLQTLVKSLKGKDDFVDVTLICEDGQRFEAHKVIQPPQALSFKFLTSQVLTNYLTKLPTEDNFLYSGSQKKFGTKTQCKVFHGGTIRGGHLNSEKPVGFCTQPEKFNIDFFPQIFFLTSPHVS